MGIVKISDLIHENLRTAGNAFSRSINAQAEHWLRVGMLAELHPDLCYADICRLMLQAEQRGDTLFDTLQDVDAAARSAPLDATARAA